VVRDLEAAALANNEEVKQARQRLVDATARIFRIRNEFNRTLRSNSAVQTARGQYEDARVAQLAADAYLIGTLDAAEIAIDYAYYVHRYDRYRYQPVYDHYNYGYGGGYGYRLRY
jgi:hypothetical protein